jgi:hypothetical protein
MTKVFNLFKNCGQNNSDFFIDNILQKPLNNSVITDSQKSSNFQNLSERSENSQQEINSSDRMELTNDDSYELQETTDSCLGKYHNKLSPLFKL